MTARPQPTKVFHFTHAQVFWFCGVAALATGSYVAATRPGAIRDLFRAPAPDVSH